MLVREGGRFVWRVEEGPSSVDACTATIQYRIHAVGQTLQFDPIATRTRWPGTPMPTVSIGELRHNLPYPAENGQPHEWSLAEVNGESPFELLNPEDPANSGVTVKITIEKAAFVVEQHSKNEWVWTIEGVHIKRRLMERRFNRSISEETTHAHVEYIVFDQHETQLTWLRSMRGTLTAQEYNGFPEEQVVRTEQEFTIRAQEHPYLPEMVIGTITDTTWDYAPEDLLLHFDGPRLVISVSSRRGNIRRHRSSEFSELEEILHPLPTKRNEQHRIFSYAATFGRTRGTYSISEDGEFSMQSEDVIRHLEGVEFDVQDDERLGIAMGLVTMQFRFSDGHVGRFAFRFHMLGWQPKGPLVPLQEKIDKMCESFYVESHISQVVLEHGLTPWKFKMEIVDKELKLVSIGPHKILDSTDVIARHETTNGDRFVIINRKHSPTEFFLPVNLMRFERPGPFPFSRERTKRVNYHRNLAHYIFRSVKPSFQIKAELSKLEHEFTIWKGHSDLMATHGPVSRQRRQQRPRKRRPPENTSSEPAKWDGPAELRRRQREAQKTLDDTNDSNRK